jgi:hypothetical protein
MNRILRSDTREQVAVGDTLVVGNGWEYKIERLPYRPGYGLLGYRNEEGQYREIALDKVGLEFEHPHRVHLSEYGGSVLVYEGLTVQVQFMDDDDSTPPWKRGDGYGIISDYTDRAKRPGERVLVEEERGSRKRYYDWAGSIQRAKDEGWDAPPYRTGTKGQQAVRAVESDFAYLQGWCKDEWRFVTIRVECEGEEDDCGGYETYKDYHVEAAWEMIEAIVEKVKEKQAAAAAAEAAAAQERAALQEIANNLWVEISSYCGGTADPQDNRERSRADFNRILEKAGLQPIAK